MKTSVRRVLLILWIVVIFVLTAYPTLETPRIKHFPEDKFYHFMAFFIMGFLAIKLMKPINFFSLGFGIAFVTEFQQLFIPGRRFELLDLMAGIIGFVVSYFVFKKGAAGDLSKT